MTFIKSLFYGLVSGLSEFLPTSSQVHQVIYMNLFGMGHREPILDMFVHIGILLALFKTCKPILNRFLREQRVVQNSRRSKIYDTRGYHELRLIKVAAVPLCIGLFSYIAARSFEQNELLICLFLLINGFLLLLPDYVRKGNKDARMMTGFDGILLGLFGAFSALPGISRIGSMRAIGSMRGASHNYILSWVILLSVPAIIAFIVLDLIGMMIYGLGTVTFLLFISYILAGVTAYAGAYLSIMLLRLVFQSNLFSGFGYYSIGSAIFVFILYLIT